MDPQTGVVQEGDVVRDHERVHGVVVDRDGECEMGNVLDGRVDVDHLVLRRVCTGQIAGDHIRILAQNDDHLQRTQRRLKELSLQFCHIPVVQQNDGIRASRRDFESVLALVVVLVVAVRNRRVLRNGIQIALFRRPVGQFPAQRWDSVQEEEHANGNGLQHRSHECHSRRRRVEGFALHAFPRIVGALGSLVAPPSSLHSVV